MIQLLRKERRRKEITLDRISDSVISLDRDWRYTFLNEPALATNPMGRDSILGKVIWDIHPELKGTIFQEKAVEAMQNGKSVELELFYQPLDCWYAVRIYPSKDGLTIYRKDISDRKNALERIIAERNLSDVIINSLPGIFYLMTQEGKFLKWNQNFEKVSGYGPEEILCMKPFDFVHPNEYELLKNKLENVFRIGEDFVELGFQRKSGEVIPYFFSGKSLIHEGRPCLLGVGLDYTEKLKTELQLSNTTNQLRDLAAHLQTVREEERMNIARDIHDDLGQQLTAIKIALFRLSDLLSDSENASGIVKEIIKMSGEAMNSVKDISARLRPAVLDDMGLVEAMRWLIEEFEGRYSLRVNAELPEFVEITDARISTHLFRIFQETLTNIARHASATSVKVKFRTIGKNIYLRVEDNGKGISPIDTRTTLNLGLLGIKERTSMMGGRFTISSQHGAGTVIEVEIPSAINNHPLCAS